MRLEDLVEQARRHGASDLHLEAGLPPTLRIRGGLRSLGEPVPAPVLLAMVQQVVPERQWAEFRERRSFDLALTLAGVRCRVNALHSMRGVGLAVRLLPATLPTLHSLNLHPDLRRLAHQPHGLVLISGPTGSGKSSTLAALLQEINLAQPRLILTIEQPVEYALRPRQAFIRQREVGRDTPSFAQGLLDALREDPDVIMVGELREPETMQLTLNAAETGHLVLATLHSSSVAEALQRLVLAFPATQQPSVASQLADVLVGVVCQQLVFRPELELRVPECEVLLPSSGAKGVIRQQEFYKLPSVLETGGKEGMWTYARYRRWLDTRGGFIRPGDEPAGPVPEGPDETLLRWKAEATLGPRKDEVFAPPPAPAPGRRREVPATAPPAPPEEGVLVIDAPGGDAASILQELGGGWSGSRR